MKRIVLALTASAILLSAANAQSVADIARQERAKKPAKSNAHVFTNENLSLRSVSDEPAPPKDPASASATGSTKPGAAEVAKKTDAAAPAEDPGKRLEEYRSKIAQQKQEITQLQREIDVAQREGKLRAAQYYGDAGSRLRDEKNYMENQRKADAELQSKQQALAQAQQKLAQLQEEARHAGVPSSQLQ